MPPTIHLLTDFSTSAEFIGVMKGAGMQWLDTVTQWKILKISW